MPKHGIVTHIMFSLGSDNISIALTATRSASVESSPADHSKPDFFQVKDIKSVISLKAETHNFPTTVEPFNGASTGTGGEIRDRMGLSST